MDPWELTAQQGHPHLSSKSPGDHGSSQKQKEANATPAFKKDRKGTQDREFLGKMMDQLILEVVLEYVFSSLNFSEGT